MAATSNKSALSELGSGMDQRSGTAKTPAGIPGGRGLVDGDGGAAKALTYIVRSCSSPYRGVLFALLVAVPCWCALIAGLMWWTA